ncbi:MULTISPECIES: acyltransferase family protein [unclassified Streptococcus]|uniref:acyltransferase family protein n=1 Tax=unclassified Streptococcus TaxID=2608887 RepID=UPI00359EF36F
MKIKWFSIIRVVGLLLVLAYHFFQKQFSGGFIGVDLFFTFSGYLVTAVFIDEFSQTGQIDLASFARRRLYRILPPLVLSVLVTLPFTLLVRLDFVASIGRQVAAALGFVTNFYEILTGGNYEAQFIPHLFVHTWSLAIEVQFYLFWGLLVWFLSRRETRINRLRGNLFLLSACLSLVTFSSMFISSFFVSNYSTIYFSSLTHVFPFFLGAYLATLVGLLETTSFYRRLSQRLKKQELALLATGAGLVLLLLGLFLDFNHIFSYLFGFLLSSLATLVLIVVCRIWSDRTPDGVNEPPVLSFLANISYGVYLFHWPLYNIFKEVMPNLLAVLLTTALSLIFASASFYLLEPWLAGGQAKIWGQVIDIAPYRRWLQGGLAVFTAVALLIISFAPATGDFERQMMVDNLHQAATQLQQTRTLAGQEKASKYDITEGVTIIGDSVTLRASKSITEALPEALVDAQGSRNLAQANEIVANHIANGSLTKYLVIGTGVNTIYNYQEELDRLVEQLPKGYHLILITPYDGNSATYDNPVAQKTRDYELTLAKTYDFITLADWHQTALSNPDIWVGSDNIHFGGDGDGIVKGATLYAQTIQKAIEEAKTKPVKN